jgi:hypothetical protein
MSLTTAYLFFMACLCGAASASLAQQAPFAPLAPVTPVVAPPAPGLGVEIQPKRSAVPGITAAPHSPSAARSMWPQPVYLVNSHIIVNSSASIKPNDIADIHVYKGASVPAQWQTLATNGLLDITLKRGVKLKLKTKSLAAIRRQAQSTGPVSCKLNGLPINDNTLRVATTGIEGLDLQRDETKTVINIRLADQPSAPSSYPPGTIMIRGIAQQ